MRWVAGALALGLLGCGSDSQDPVKTEPQTCGGPAGPVCTAGERCVEEHALCTTLPDVLDMEVEAQLKAFASPDFREGITAFLEKRTPRFNRPRRGDA